MRIMFNDLSKQWEEIKSEVQPKLEELFEKSNFIGGADISEFEKKYAKYCETKFAVGASNGTDALKLCLAAFDLKPTCGIIIPANTFIATALAITYLNEIKYELALIDCDEFYQIDIDLLQKYLKKNRKKWNSCVIIPVHLYGHPANMEQVLELAERYNCYVLEDASQAHGALVLNKKVGSLGNISAFSLYPGKNLGAAGDAGIITTNDEDLYTKVKSLRNYGSSKKYQYDYKGWNNRMDTIQAIILNEKLKYLDKWNDKRIKVAESYNNKLDSNNKVVIPRAAPYINKQVYHIYAIRIKKRDELQHYLNENNVPTIIHYPIPIQKTTPFKYLDHFENPRTIEYSNDILSLPIHPYLEEEEISYITEKINDFCND